MSGFELISYLWIFGNKAVCNVFSFLFPPPFLAYVCFHTYRVSIMTFKYKLAD